jgi:TRAP transporter TAXI family solute receptor
MVRRKKLIVAVFLSCALGMLLASPEVQAVQHFSMVSSTPGGTWYTMVGAAVTLYTQKIPDTKFTIAASGGSVENARRFMSGEADFGLIYSSHLYDLYHGTGTFKGKSPGDAAQVLCQVYDSSHYFVTLKGKGIRSISDLAGKRVALGPPGSGTSANSKKTFETLGIKVNGIELAFGDAARQLQDGKIDALGQGGAPASGVVELAASKDIEIIPFNNAELEKMVSLAPYFFKGILPANTYRGQDKDVPTFFFAVFLAAHKKVPENIAYQVLKVTFSPEGKTVLSNAHPQWKTIKDNPEAVKQLGAKYHPGAVKFWKEGK